MGTSCSLLDRIPNQTEVDKDVDLDEISSQIIKRQSEETSKKNICDSGDQCKHDRWAACQAYQFRKSICFAVRFWIRQYPVHFDLDVKLSAVVKDWQRCLVSEEQYHYPELIPLIDLSCLPSYDWIRNISVRDSTVKHCRKVSLVFNHLEPSELAKHLTYLEHRIMRRISVSTLLASPHCVAWNR